MERQQPKSQSRNLSKSQKTSVSSERTSPTAPLDKSSVSTVRSSKEETTKINIRKNEIKLLAGKKLESKTMRIYTIRFLQSLKDPDDPKIVFNTVCFLLLSLLGEKINDKFCSLMDSLMPITNVKNYMTRFDEQHSMAMLFHKNLAHVLSYWYFGALQWHEKVKTQLLEIQCAELFLRFLAQQSVGFKTFLDRIIDQAGKDFQTPGIHGELNIASSPEINVDITIDNQRAVLKLDSALEAVLSQKRIIFEAAETSALYVRCIKELMEINASNTAKIHSYHFRWNPIKAFGKFYRDRLALKLPYSDLHKAYAAVHLGQQETPPNSTASPKPKKQEE